MSQRDQSDRIVDNVEMSGRRADSDALVVVNRR